MLAPLRGAVEGVVEGAGVREARALWSGYAGAAGHCESLVTAA